MIDEEQVSGEEALEGFYAALLDDDPDQLYDRAPCGYLSTTPDGTIVKVNRTFLTLTGHERSELVGRRRFVDLLSGGGRIYHETHYAPLLQVEGAAHEIALDLVRTDGQRIPVLVNSVLERDAAGQPTVIRTAVFDATHRRDYERALLDEKRRAEAAEERATALARTLQATLLPPALPSVPGLDVAGRYHPAGRGADVGGDFYDLFETAGGSWIVTIGDVCGKGIEAAVMTSLVRSTIRAASVRPGSPSATLELLNEVLLRHGNDRFVTTALLHLHPSGDGWSVEIASGGHPLPLLAREGSVATVGRPGPLVGMLPEALAVDVIVELSPGDVVVLHTDGVEEARSDDGFYGEERLMARVGDAAAVAGSAQAVADALVDDVLAFQAGTPRDDIAVVVLRVPPQG